MCELLVWISDSEKNEDPYKDCKRGKAGNVITIQEDGWKWSNTELSHPQLRVVSIPGLSPSDQSMATLLMSEADQRKIDNPLDPLANYVTNPMLRAKTWAIDISAIAMTKAGTITPASKLSITTTAVKLAPLADPAVIGISSDN